MRADAFVGAIDLFPAVAQQQQQQLLSEFKNVLASCSEDPSSSAAAKAFDRAHSAEPDKVEHVTQLEGCCPRAVAAHAGRKHILAVSFSGPPAIERFFAFEDMRTRDSFMEKLQV